MFVKAEKASHSCTLTASQWLYAERTEHLQVYIKLEIPLRAPP